MPFVEKFPPILLVSTCLLTLGWVGCGLTESDAGQGSRGVPDADDSRGVDEDAPPGEPTRLAEDDDDENELEPPLSQVVIPSSTVSCLGDCSVSTMRFEARGTLGGLDLAGTGLLVQWGFESKRHAQLIDWQLDDTVTTSTVRTAITSSLPGRDKFFYLVHDEGWPHLVLWDQGQVSVDGKPDWTGETTDFPLAATTLGGKLHLLESGADVEDASANHYLSTSGDSFTTIPRPRADAPLDCFYDRLWRGDSYGAEIPTGADGEMFLWSEQDDFSEGSAGSLACRGAFDGEGVVLFQQPDRYVRHRIDGGVETLLAVEPPPPMVCFDHFIAYYPDICEFDPELLARRDDSRLVVLRTVVAREGAVWAVEVEADVTRTCESRLGPCFETLPCDCSYEEQHSYSNASLVIRGLLGDAETYEVPVQLDGKTQVIGGIDAHYGPQGLEVAVAQQAYTSGSFSHLVVDRFRVTHEDGSSL